MYIEIFLSLIIGYLLGSIPFALVIGKVFYKTDVREFGSKNLGGGNTGRVLGKRAGVAVMTMDILKVTLAIFLASFLEHDSITTVTAGLASAIGHCFPVFAGFKGGKAVATMYGFLFGMALCGGYGLWIFILPLVGYLVVLYICKIVSLASICSSVIAAVVVYILTGSILMLLALLVFVVLITVRHRANIARMLKGEERKITWM